MRFTTLLEFLFYFVEGITLAYIHKTYGLDLAILLFFLINVGFALGMWLGTNKVL